MGKKLWRAISAVLLVLATMAFTAPASAQIRPDVVDQSNLDEVSKAWGCGGCARNNLFGQQFVPQADNVSVVDLMFEGDSVEPHTADVTVTLRSSHTDPNALGSATTTITTLVYPSGSLNDTYATTGKFVFDPPVVVTPGVQYFLEVDVPSQDVRIHGTNNTYSDGDVWFSGAFRTNRDLRFRTYTRSGYQPPPEPPTISSGVDVTAEASGPTGATVTYVAPTAVDDAGAALSVTCAAPSGSTFALGDTAVTCSATDAIGQVASTQFTVTVSDTVAPDITVPNDIEVTVSSAPTTVDFQATAVDVVDGDVVTSCSAASGSSFNEGVTTVTCEATDAALNSASDSFTVSVVVAVAAAPLDELITDLETLADSNSGGAERQLNRAIASIERAQAHLAASPTQPSAAIVDLRIAVGQLYWADVFGVDDAAIDAAYDVLEAQARTIATDAIQDAVDRGGRSRRIDLANRLVDRGDGQNSTNRAMASYQWAAYYAARA